MAFDLLTRSQNGRSWARGNTVWSRSHGDVVVDMAKAQAKKLPWMKIAGGACFIVGTYLIFSPEKKPHELKMSDVRNEDEGLRKTRQIKNLSMQEMVYGRKA